MKKPSYSALSKITTPLPLSGRNITMFLFFLSSFKILCFFKSEAVGRYHETYVWAKCVISVTNLPVPFFSLRFFNILWLINSKHAKISVLLIEGGQIECVSPSLRTFNWSALRITDKRLVTTSSDVKGRTEFFVTFLNFFSWVLMNYFTPFFTLWSTVLWRI